MNYRAEIDGLRAIAVVSVIFYHAKIVIFGRDWFEGGFVGVDIFFVISGSIKSAVILPESKSTSAKTGLAPNKTPAEVVATKLLGVVINSSPSLKPNAL